MVATRKSTIARLHRLGTVILSKAVGDSKGEYNRHQAKRKLEWHQDRALVRLHQRLQSPNGGRIGNDEKEAPGDDEWQRENNKGVAHRLQMHTAGQCAERWYEITLEPVTAALNQTAHVSVLPSYKRSTCSSTASPFIVA